MPNTGNPGQGGQQNPKPQQDDDRQGTQKPGQGNPSQQPGQGGQR